MSERPVVMNTKHLKDADALLAKGEFRQASGKLWEAVEIAVKAATRDWSAEGPRDTRRLVEQLFRESGDRDLLRLYSVVESLHTNAQENFMSGDAVQAYAEDAHTFLEKLGALPAAAEAPSGGGAIPAPPSHEQQLGQRQQSMVSRLEGLPRKQARREIVAEVGRTDEQLEAVGGRRKNELAGPGFTAARIAGLMRELEASPQGNRAAVDLLGQYKRWLLELLIAR